MTYILGIDTSIVSATAEFALGTIGRSFDGKLYKYVTYDDGTANLDLADGDVVYYVDDSGYGANTVTADVSDSTGKEIGAGVAPVAVTLDGSNFWIQIKGAATLAVTIAGSPADGDALTATAAADKALTLAKEADSAAAYVTVVAIGVDVSAKEIICMFPE